MILKKGGGVCGDAVRGVGEETDGSQFLGPRKETKGYVGGCVIGNAYEHEVAPCESLEEC